MRPYPAHGSAPRARLACHRHGHPADGSAPQWCYCLGTMAVCVISGLSSGQQYQFRAAAWNGVSETPYSQVETRYVQ